MEYSMYLISKTGGIHSMKWKFFVRVSIPLTGAPSMISYLAIVSFSVNTFTGPEPVVSRFIIAISMCLILMRTSKK